MSGTVTVIDYGMGNLFSVQRALEHCGAQVLIATEAVHVESAERIVLPGVGAFEDGMRGLRESALIDPLKRFAARGAPLLGICLGMQMLASVSEEFGEHAGLGLIPGRVVAIPDAGSDGRPHKIPHIGWNKLARSDRMSTWHGSILEDTAEGEPVYLVHSFTVVPEAPEHRLADCYYDGCLISAAIRAARVYGCQFHPEKSGPAGLRILSRFLSA